MADDVAAAALRRRSPMKSTDRSNQGRIFSQKESLTGTRRKWDSAMKSGLGQVLLAFRT